MLNLLMTQGRGIMPAESTRQSASSRYKCSFKKHLINAREFFSFSRKPDKMLLSRHQSECSYALKQSFCPLALSLLIFAHGDLRLEEIPVK
jgi:hypothetical protein